MAGGSSTSSVVTLLPGATAWTPLAALPRTLGYARASIVGGNLRVTGGFDGSSLRSEVVMNHYSDARCEFIVVVTFALLLIVRCLNTSLVHQTNG